MSRICLQIALSSISGILSNFLIVPGRAQAVKNAHCHSPQALSTISTAGSSGSSGVRPQHSPVWNATTATTTARRTTFNKLCIFVLIFFDRKFSRPGFYRQVSSETLKNSPAFIPAGFNTWKEYQFFFANLQFQISTFGKKINKFLLNSLKMFFIT